MALKRLKAGDSPTTISASTWNAFCSHVEAAGPPGRATPTPGAGEVRFVRNDTGRDVARFGLLGVDAILYGPNENLPEFQARAVFLGVIPTAAHAGRYCVAQEPIAAGKIGRCLVSGVSPIWLAGGDVGDPRPNTEWAELAPDATLRLARVGSAQVLWRDPDQSVGWAIVLLGAGTRMADRCTCQLVDDSDTENAQVDHVTPIDGGQSPLQDPSDMAETLYAAKPPRFRAPAGAEAVISYNQATQSWKIDSYDGYANRIKAQASAVDGPGDVTVANAVSLDGGQVPDSPTVKLEFNWAISDGATVYAEWNYDASSPSAEPCYVVYAADCPTTP